jgi:Tol biopolymer transport system component
MSIDHDDDPQQEEPQQKEGRSCLFIAVSIVVIFSLVATSLASLIWFIGNRRIENQAPAVMTSPIQEATSPPAETDAGETPSAMETGAAAEEVEPTAEALAESDEAGPRLNRIVIVNEDGQIETLAPDGSDRHLLTDNDQIYEFPAWSPDGNYIAALGNDRNGGGIYLLQDEEGAGIEEELFYSEEQRPFYLYWSPDGRQISFLANNPLYGIGLNLIDAQVGGESREIALGSPLYWDWAADSEQLLVHSGNEQDESSLVLIDSEGEDQTPQIPAPGFFQAPGISPSGQYWAFSQLREGGNGWVTIENRSNGDQTAERHAGAAALNWSPVADQLAFISGSDGEEFSFWGPLRLIDMDSGETRLLSSDLVLAFFWSPNGKQIFTISVQLEDGLDGGVEVRETKRRHLARTRPVQRPAQRTPHQFMLSVINVEDGSGLQLAEVPLSPVFLAQFLVYFDQYALSHTLWSPDSKQIVLPILADGESQIAVISTNSGRLQTLGIGSIAFWSRQ